MSIYDFLNYFDRTIRQSLQKRASVRASHDAIVENRDDPAIIATTNQAAKTLLCVLLLGLVFAELRDRIWRWSPILSARGRPQEAAQTSVETSTAKQALTDPYVKVSLHTALVIQSIYNSFLPVDKQFSILLHIVMVLL